MINQRGLILIELIMTIVLVGIIATFTGLFIYFGIDGYLTAKNISNESLDAQRALDRISMELRDISTISGTPGPETVTYKSTVLTGTRTLKFVENADTVYIRIDPTDYPLLEGVSAFKLSYSYLDLDDDTATPEVAGINVEFSLNEIGTKFKANIFPRNLVKKTW